MLRLETVSKAPLALLEIRLLRNPQFSKGNLGSKGCFNGFPAAFLAQ